MFFGSDWAENTNKIYTSEVATSSYWATIKNTPMHANTCIPTTFPLEFDKMSEDVTQNHAQCIKILKFKRLAVQNFERQNRDLIFNQCRRQLEHHDCLKFCTIKAWCVLTPFWNSMPKRPSAQEHWEIEKPLKKVRIQSRVRQFRMNRSKNWTVRCKRSFWSNFSAARGKIRLLETVNPRRSLKHPDSQQNFVPIQTYPFKLLRIRQVQKLFSLTRFKIVFSIEAVYWSWCLPTTTHFAQTKEILL